MATKYSTAQYGKLCQIVAGQIDFFKSTNRTPDISMSTFWETLKAYVRGEIISYTALMNKMKKDRLTVLTRSIAQLDDIYSVSPSPDIYNEHLTLQAEFDTIVTDQITELLFKSRSTYYEQGDKAGRLLAHKLRQSSSSHQISRIRTSAGAITLDPRGINDEFSRFYQSLYTSEYQPDTSDLDNFFHSLDVPVVSRDLVEKLEEPITVEELSIAVKSLQSGESPGPDGYPVEFYEKLFPKLAPILLEMYNEAFANEILPPTLTQATISLILKKTKILLTVHHTARLAY